jgi:hypothetical protein
MQAEKQSRAAVGRASLERAYPPLESVTRPVLDTASAAHYLCRKQQTLRVWACFENGPLRPIRVNGRLAWSVVEIRRLLGVGS